ncbi:hypothetical protein [Altererythrobacter aquiaggeris]|uniref:hypothetical protein n=1 Tax=Aestuarierythrobacter aquiaggeris TaxID=1898396 RepID=UPI00301A0A03
MSRIANAVGIKPNMYRHFAIFTVAGTLMLAFFADGEGRQEVVRQVGTKSDALARKGDEIGDKGRATFTKPFTDPDAYSNGGFGSDAGSDGFGSPMDSAGGGAGESSLIPPGIAGSERYVPASYRRYGLTEEEWAALSADEKAQIIKLVTASRASAPTARQIESLAAASRERSRATSGGE